MGQTKSAAAGAESTTLEARAKAAYLFLQAAQHDHAGGHFAVAVQAHSLAMRWLSRREEALFSPYLRAAEDHETTLAGLAIHHLKQAIDAEVDGAAGLHAQWKVEGFADFDNDDEMRSTLRAAASAANLSYRNDARYRLGVCLLATNPTAALTLLMRAAAEVHAGAIYRLGRCYLNGEGVELDRNKALTLLNQAADLGRSDAWFALGRMHLDSGNPREAARHFSESVELGNGEAMHDMAQLLDAGAGVRRDEITARRLMLKAAHAGHPRAAFEVGKYHLEGRKSFKRDSHRAAQWYRQAARGTRPRPGTFALYERGAMKEGEERWELRECPALPGVAEARHILESMIARDEVAVEPEDHALLSGA